MHEVNPVGAEVALRALNCAAMQTPKNRLPRASGPFWPGILLIIAGPLCADDTGVDPLYRGEVERGGFEYDDSGDIPWIENETKVLAMPQADDLRTVQIDALPGNLELLIDETRITVDPKDRVVRVWLWVRSDSGAESGTFEGFRCSTREYKVYAYANPRRDPPVRKATRANWLSAKKSRTANYRAELLNHYFCGIRGTRDADEIRSAMTGEFRRETFFSN
jgi:hypothetical protein